MIFFLLAFICFALMDELAHHFDDITIKWIKNNYAFWDKRKSWINKWAIKRMDVSHSDYTSHIINTPDVTKERFWGSSRWFVFLTDGWHLIQFFAYQLIAMGIGVNMYETLWIALVASIPIHLLCVTIKSAAMKLI